MENILTSLKRSAAGLLICVSLIGLNGYVTSSFADEKDLAIQGKFMAKKGDLKIMDMDKDLYTEKLDGSEKRRITNTPYIEEYSVAFSKDGKYVLYSTIQSGKKLETSGDELGIVVTNSDHFFFQPADKDDGNKKEISLFEYNSLRREE